MPTLVSVLAPSSAPVGAPSSSGVEIRLATSITLTGLRCADYDASAEAALKAGLAACVDGIAAEDVGSTECVDLGGGRRALLISSANISFVLDMYSSSPAAEVVSSVSSQLSDVASSGELMAAVVDASAGDTFDLVAAAHSSITLVSPTSAPSALTPVPSSGEGARLSGAYSDPNHPGCPRRIVVRPDEAAADVSGEDSTAPSGACDVAPGGGVGAQSVAWGPIVAWFGPDAATGRASLAVDFSSKGGPTHLVGVWDEDGSRIIWADGNAWTRVGAASATATPTPAVTHAPTLSPTSAPPARDGNWKDSPLVMYGAAVGVGLLFVLLVFCCCCSKREKPEPLLLRERSANLSFSQMYPNENTRVV